MIVEIVSVGTELLMGQVANTDAQYIASRISPLGCRVLYHSTVGDNQERLRELALTALGRADAVIFTGGLGPTRDDLTKETVASALGLDCVPDEAEIRRLRERCISAGREPVPEELKQACFPPGSIILPNRNGTAPGCVLEKDGKTAILLPGPPRELEPMVDESVLPYLEKRCGYRLYSREVRLLGMGEARASHLLRDLIDAQSNPTVAPYIKPGEVTFRVTARCADEAEGKALCEPVLRSIRKTLGDCVYTTDGESIAELVVRLLKERNKTVSTAESLTGGLLADRIVSVPGSSAVFREGFVTYSDDAKIRLLGVREDTIRKHTAVSAETAREMAEGLLARTGADYALATTGYAGPDGADVGLVYAAIACRGETRILPCRFSGDRALIRLRSAYAALDLLRRNLCT